MIDLFLFLNNFYWQENIIGLIYQRIQIKAMNRRVIAFNMIESLGMVEKDDVRAMNKD